MTRPTPSILLIEDDPAIRKFMRASLESTGYRTIESPTAKDGLLQAATRNPDVIILDLGLPDLDGVDVTRQIRLHSAVPIIIVSARGKEQDKVAALDTGADDYLTKPFSMGELLARIRAALRRADRLAAPESLVFSLGQLRVDLERRSVTVNNAEIHLTPNQYRLLLALIKNAGRVVTHQDLLKAVQGETGGETHYLRVYINQLRQKIDNDPAHPRLLLTEPGIGYRLLDELPESS